MVDLQAGQASGRQLLDRLVRHGAAADSGQRVREDGDPTSAQNQADRVQHVEGGMRDVVRRALVQVSVERLLAVGDDAGLNQRIGQVRSAHGRRARNGHDLLPADVDAGRRESFGHALQARDPVAAYPPHALSQRWVGAVHQVTEQVQPDRVAVSGPDTRQLHTGDQRDPHPVGRDLRLVQAGECVMVGERHHIQVQIRRALEQRGRGQRAVARRRVRVEVDAHGRQATARLVRPLSAVAVSGHRTGYPPGRRPRAGQPGATGRRA